MKLENFECHMEISLNELIARQNMMLSDLWDKQQVGDTAPILAAQIKGNEDRLDDLNESLEWRRRELQQERHLTIADKKQDVKRQPVLRGLCQRHP
jgi:hypothetical protein